MQKIHQQTCFLFQSIVVSPRSSVFFQHLSLLRSLSGCGSSSSLRFRLFGSFCVRSLFMIFRHIFEISDDSRMRITTKSVHDKNDDFALRYVRIYPGVNSRAELVTLAPGLRPERRFAPLARGKKTPAQLHFMTSCTDEFFVVIVLITTSNCDLG